MKKPLDWWIKWVSSVILLIGMSLTSINLFPLNLLIEGVGALGWLVVSVMWKDRALIFVNTCALTLISHGLLLYFLKSY